MLEMFHPLETLHDREQSIRMEEKYRGPSESNTEPSIMTGERKRVQERERTTVKHTDTQVKMPSKPDEL